MPGRLTVWGASQLLTAYFSKRTEPPPDFYVALIRNIAPTPFLDGSELDEPDNLDYHRAAIPNNLACWYNDSQPQEVYNAKAAAFVTATSTWGMCKYWALCNAPVDGYNMLVGELETPVLVEAGDQVVFTTGDLNLTLGPFYMFEAE